MSNTQNESNGDKFIEPVIQDLCPELYELASKRMVHTEYHLEELYKLLFRSANHASKNQFNKKKSSLSRGLTEDISHHIYEMFDHREKRTTIINMCNKFEVLCNQFLSDTHPLSLRLIEENNRVQAQQKEFLFFDEYLEQQDEYVESMKQQLVSGVDDDANDQSNNSNDQTHVNFTTGIDYTCLHVYFFIILKKMNKINMKDPTNHVIDQLQ